jgi:hypothetical protein
MITPTTSTKPQIGFKGLVKFDDDSYDYITKILAGCEPTKPNIEEVRAFNEAVLNFQKNTPDTDVIDFYFSREDNPDGSKNLYIGYKNRHTAYFKEKATETVPAYSQIKDYLNNMVELSQIKQSFLKQLKK